jgi:ATP-binding cassette subfamily B protein
VRGFVQNVTQAVSYILVATRYSHDITLSSLALLQSGSEEIVWNLENLWISFDLVLVGMERMENYFNFLDPEINPSSTARMEPFSAYHETTGRGMKIVAKDVTFGYPTQEPILKGLNFTIEPGELIAIVGGNGSGKSTLVKLLARLYDVNGGSLEINDVDIRRYDTDEFWSHISTINQDFGTSQFQT